MRCVITVVGKDTVGIFSENFSKNFCGDVILCEKNPQRIIRIYVGEFFRHINITGEKNGKE